jgi:hypothetical protein
LYPQLYLLIQSLNAFLQATKERQGAPWQRASDCLQMYSVQGSFGYFNFRLTVKIL